MGTRRFVWVLTVLLSLVLFTCGKDSTTGSDLETLDLPNGLTLVSIPSGTFLMGDIQGGGYDDEKPVHTVTLSAFEMSATEITQGQYEEVIGANPSFYEPGNDYPVERVRWYNAVHFCNKLSEIAGLEQCYNESTMECDFSKNGFRLPTEAEWEYACRAGTDTKFYTGNDDSDLDQAGWYGTNSNNKTHPVGVKEQNAWELYDMYGNVKEWCHDLYGPYTEGTYTNPTGADSGTRRVIRGGWYSNGAKRCRSAAREGREPDVSELIGFRVVRRP